MDSRHLIIAIVVIGVACTEAANPHIPSTPTDPPDDPPPGPWVELETGPRRLTARERGSFVQLCAEIACLPAAVPSVGEAPTSPESLDYTATLVARAGLSIVDFGATAVGYAQHAPTLDETRAAVVARCGRDSVPSFVGIAEGLKVRRLSTVGRDDLAPLATRYVSAAVELLCLALGSTPPSNIDVARGEILERHGFDDASLGTTSNALRGDPSVLASIVAGVRQCEGSPVSAGPSP